MDFRLLIRHRLKEMGTEQRDLAAAAKVTESYISQLLTGKKAPPAPERTDIYDKMETFLRLPAGKLAMLADRLRTDALKRKLVDPPAPLFKEVRELILGKCEPGKEQSIRAIFEKEPFGALERLVTQKLLDVVKRVTKEESDDEDWLRLVARLEVHTEEPVEEDAAAVGSQEVLPRLDVEARVLEARGRHLRGDRSLPDDCVELQLIRLEVPLHAVGRAREIRIS